MRVHRQVGGGDDSNYPARSGERSEKALPKSTLNKGGIGQQR